MQALIYDMSVLPVMYRVGVKCIYDEGLSHVRIAKLPFRTAQIHLELPIIFRAAH